MGMTVRAEAFDFIEAIALAALRQNEVTNQGGFARSSARESHPDLEHDSRFLRDGMDTAAAADELGVTKVRFPYLRLAAAEQILEREFAAGM